MPISYTYTASSFTNATRLDVGDIHTKLAALVFTSATYLYTDGGLPSSGYPVKIYFSTNLSAGEKTTLDNFVIAYVDPLVLLDIACKISDIKTSGTDGGTLLANTWTTRTLNTLEGSVSFATLSNNVITLLPGKYIVTVKAPTYGVGASQIRIRNITDSIYYLGTNSYSTLGMVTSTDISQYLNLDHTINMDIQQIGSLLSLSVGLGKAGGFGTNEIYITFFILRTCF